MLKFEPEAMRALVKYKVLKKLIGQCVDRRPKKDAEGVQQEKEDEQLTEEEKERDLQAMKGLRIRILCHISRFIETIIEDVIAANQYYTKKLSAINQEYEDLSAIVSEELVKVPLLAPFHVQKRGFFSRWKRDHTVLQRIYTLLGEMLLLQYFSATNYQGIRKVVSVIRIDLQIIKKFRKVTHSSAVDGLMTIITNSPSRDITTQNDIISDIITLYFVRKMDDSRIKVMRGCNKNEVYSFEEMKEQAKEEESPDEVVELRDHSMQSVIERNTCALSTPHSRVAMPGKDVLRDVVFRGKRVLKSHGESLP